MKANKTDIHIGERVKFYRLVKKLSQRQLGEELGVTSQQVQKYENGTNRISASGLYAISERLGVHVVQFFPYMRFSCVSPKAIALGEDIEKLPPFQQEVVEQIILVMGVE